MHIPLHGNKKSWSGLNDIDVVKWIKRHVQCVNNLLKCYVRLSVMQADQINCLKPLEIWDFGLALAS